MSDLISSHNSLQSPAEAHSLHQPSTGSSFDYSDEVSQATEVSSLETYLEAASRYRTSRYYIQAVVIGRSTFLATNLIPEQSVHFTAISSCWAVGRNATCAIPVYERSVSRCHAVIGRHAEEGFYISDLGSSNGTWVNGDRLPTSARYPLRHGDVVRLGRIDLEFFITLPMRSSESVFEDTCS
jgi:hypothetical protein